MSSLKFAVLCVLTAYLLVVAFNFITKLRDARLMQKLLYMLFPISQICLIAFPLACSARYGLPAAVYVSLIVLGIACGPVDLLLFRALDQACRWFDSSSKVNMLQEQLQVQSALRQRSRHERDQASALRDQLRERLEQARADLRADQAGKAGESLEDVISLIGARPQRFCQHPAVDALLEQKARAASDSGVRFRAELDIPADIQLPGVELCAVFSNLLDNALNACAQSPDGQPRRSNCPLVGDVPGHRCGEQLPASSGAGTGRRRSGIGRRRRSGRWRCGRLVPRSVRASWLGAGHRARGGATSRRHVRGGPGRRRVPCARDFEAGPGCAGWR